MAAVALAIHGGAGARPGGDLAAERESAQRESLSESLRAGYRVLNREGSALDAVEAAVRVLEDAPELNAGIGSVLTADGTVEMDACIADGQARRVGAVAAIRRIANPIGAARALLDDGRHVLLVGDGAERFAFGCGLPEIDPDRLVTGFRREQLVAAMGAAAVLDHDGGGTVGAVARDAQGRLAAGTSTGGMTNQLPGRVGDSPLPAAGTWADARCAVSGTGTGEAFMRAAFAGQVAARLRHAGAGLEEACRAALADVAGLGGRGGCVAVAPEGGPVLCFDTSVMFRGWIDEHGEAWVAIGDESGASPATL